MSTRPRSVDVSVGQVRLLPPDITSPVGPTSGLFQTANAPAVTRPELPAATSTLPVGHRPSGRVSNRLSCTLVSDCPTWMPASPGYRNQHTSDSRSSCDRPHLLNWRVAIFVIHWSWTQVQGRPLHRTGIICGVVGLSPTSTTNGRAAQCFNARLEGGLHA